MRTIGLALLTIAVIPGAQYALGAALMGPRSVYAVFPAAWLVLVALVGWMEKIHG